MAHSRYLPRSATVETGNAVITTEVHKVLYTSHRQNIGVDDNHNNAMMMMMTTKM